jgi:hypothetical protein
VTNRFRAASSASVQWQRVLSQAPPKYHGRPIVNCSAITSFLTLKWQHLRFETNYYIVKQRPASCWNGSTASGPCPRQRPRPGCTRTAQVPSHTIVLKVPFPPAPPGMILCWVPCPAAPLVSMRLRLGALLDRHATALRDTDLGRRISAIEPLRESWRRRDVAQIARCTTGAPLPR